MYCHTFVLVSPVVILAIASAHPLRRQQRSLQWGPCEFDFNSTAQVECSTVQVPLDWTMPNTSKPLELELLRVKATEEPFLGSILFNPGGPGALGTKYVAEQHKSFNRALDGHYDLVGFDIRGTGRTIPFACNITALLDSNTKRDIRLPQRDMVDYLEMDAWYEAQRFADQCYEDNEEIGSYMSTAFTARDTLAIVDALGEDDLRFWGASYGTILGQTFASMFPHKVDRMWLEAVMDPVDYVTGLWTHNMMDTDKSLDNFLEECLSAPALCRLANITASPTVESLRLAISDVLVDLYDTQETTQYGYHALMWFLYYKPAMRYEDFKRKIFTSVYYVSNFPLLDDILTSIITRNFSATDFQPDPTAEADRTTLLVNAGYNSIHAVSCSDANLRTRDAKDFHHLVREQQASSDLADSYLPAFWACPAWRFEPAERFEGPFSGKTKTPILFANGLADPITPMAHAQMVHDRWEGSGLLIHGGHGHGVENHPSTCTDQVIRAYFFNATIPEEGTRCEPNMPAFQWAYEQLNL